MHETSPGLGGGATTQPGGPDEPALLRRFGIGPGAILGAGGEARVFAVDEHRVLRILYPSDGPLDGNLVTLLNGWVDADLGFSLPQLLDSGRSGVQNWSVEKRIPGISGAAWLASTPDRQLRRRGLLSMLDAAGRLRELPLPRIGYRRVVDRRTFDSLSALASFQIGIGLHHSDGLLHAAVPDLPHQVAELLDRLRTREVEPEFVHNDYCPANLMMDADGSVTGVLDVSVHALAADPVMDQVAATMFLTLTPYPAVSQDEAWLCAQLAERLGPDAWLIDAYRRFYACYYSMDHALIPWAAEILNRRD